MFLLIGDLVIEINGELLYEKDNSLAIVQKVLSAHRGKATLAVLPCNRHKASPASGHFQQNGKTPRELYAKVRIFFCFDAS